MYYKEYMEKYGDKDHVLLVMNNEYPYFTKKKIIENGEERLETNYHIATGNFNNYINYEMKFNFCASIEGLIHFEIGKYDNPIFVTNIGNDNIEIRVNDCYGCVKPGEVLGIHPYEIGEETVEVFNSRLKENMLSQEEIVKLLGGNV